MKKLLAVSVMAMIASCSGHPAYAIDLSKEKPSPRVEDVRGDYRHIGADYIVLEGSIWLRNVYVPAPYHHDQHMQVCVIPKKYADTIDMWPVCFPVQQSTKVEEGLY